MPDVQYRSTERHRRLTTLLTLGYYNLANHQRTEQLRDDAADEHLLAQLVGEQQHQVVGVHAVHDGEQHRRQRQQHDAGQPAFAGERLDLAPNLEPLADQVADLVEDFGQVTTRLPLQDDGRGEELEVEVGNALGEVFERFLERLAEVLLFERAAEFAADRVGHFLRHQAEAGRQAVAGTQRAGDQLQRFAAVGRRTSSAAACV